MKRNEFWIKSTSFVILILIICLIISGCIGNNGDNEKQEDNNNKDNNDGQDDNKTKNEEMIEKVEITPKNPTSKDTIRITLFLNKPYKENNVIYVPKIEFVSLFNKNVMDNIQSNMEEKNDKEFYMDIGPFNEGDQIWIIIYLFMDNKVILYENTIDIGPIKYSSDLNINVSYSEDEFKNSTSSNITADIFYEDTIHSIQIHYLCMKFDPSQRLLEGVGRNCTPINYRDQISQGHERCKIDVTDIASNELYLFRWVCFDKSNVFSTQIYQIHT